MDACRNFFGSLARVTVLLFLVLFLKGCAGDQRIEVVLPLDARLEQTPPGWWIRELDLPHQNELLEEVSDKLAETGELIDQYSEDGGTTTKIYRVTAQQQVLQTTDPFFIVRENRNTDSVWFEVPLQPVGIHWVNIMSFGGSVFESTTLDELAWLDGPKPVDHVATITSPGESNARLLLFGRGRMCEEVILR